MISLISMTSMEECLKPILHYLSPELISQEALSETLKVTRNLPQSLGYSMFGFEIRLEEGASDVDFLVCASAKSGGRQGLTDLMSNLNCAGISYGAPVWENILDFIGQWNEHLSLIYTNIDNIWLEFDSKNNNSFHIVPSVFFEPVAKENERNKQVETIETCLKLLRPEKFSKKQMNLISNCFQKLPSGAKIYQTGVMLSRTGSLTRLCIQSVPLTQLNDYLENIGLVNNRLGDNNKYFLSIINDLVSVTDAIGIDIDLTDTIGKTIGIECYCYTLEKLQSLLDYIGFLGLCTLKKKDALLKFSGVSDSVKDAAIWPENLLSVALLLGPNLISTFVCSVDHIKIVYHPNHNLKAKAYLAVRHQWLTQCSV